MDSEARTLGTLVENKLVPTPNGLLTDQRRHHNPEWNETFDALPDHVAILDLSGAILHANRTLRDRFEPKYGNLEGLDYRLLYCGTPNPNPQPPCASVLSGGPCVCIETVLPTIPGWFRVVATPIHDATGRQWGAISIVQDISRQHELEHATRERQQQLDEVIRASLDGIVLIDEVGIITLWNRQAEEILGWTSEEAFGRRLSELIIPPEFRDRHNLGIEAYRRTRSSSLIGQRIVLPALHRQGHRIQIELSMTGVFLGEKAVICGSFRDLTDQLRTQKELNAYRDHLEQLVAEKTAELKLSIGRLENEIHDRTIAQAAQQASEMRLRTVLETIHECILTCSTDGFITYSKGIPPLAIAENPVGRHISNIWQPDVGAIVLNSFNAASYQIQTRACQVCGADKHGERSFATIRVTPVVKGDNVTELVVVYQDTTKDCLLQEELQRHVDTQTHMSRLSALGEMASSIAHEINQPLYAISNYATAIRRRVESSDADNAEFARILNLMSNEANRAGEIIHRIRQFAKRRDLEISEFDLAQALVSSIEITRHEAYLARIAVHSRFAGGEGISIKADRLLIEQVMVNLLLNAIFAMSQVEMTCRNITVTVTVVENTVRVEVMDGGPGFGIPPMHAFEPFVTTKANGTGLGLSICRTIIESHGGRIWASNLATGGACVSFDLRLESQLEPTNKEALRAE